MPTSAYGDADLALRAVNEADLRQAVATSRSWRGVLRALGVQSSRHARALKSQCDRTGIDYGHFRGRRWSDGDLRDALVSANSWRDLLQSLGYAEDSGSARATVRKHAGRLCLDLRRLEVAPRPPACDAFAGEADGRHLRDAGAYLVAAACAMRGFKISWPLEPAVYDLLIDTGRSLLRVQVKTTTWRLHGAFACKITRRSGGEKTWYTKDDIDYFGVVDGDQQVYMIPVEVVDGTGTIIVRQYDAFRISAFPVGDR